MMRTLTFLSLFVLLLLSWAADAQTNRFAKIEDDVEELLQKRDLGDLATELSGSKGSPSVESLLIKLSVFGRAGQRTRVHETLKQLSESLGSNVGDQDHMYRVKAIALKAIGSEDIAGQKIFFESIYPSGGNETHDFTRLWIKTGDVAELEKWLAARADRYPRWWDEWVGLKKELGTAQEIFDKLAQDIRSDPTDWHRIERYFQIAGNEDDTGWIVDVVPTNSSYVAYELGTYLERRKPLTAISLFEKSLSLPFTENDLKLFGELAFRMTAVVPIIKDPEKQLRYWTKTRLVKLYLNSGQSQFAQPLVQELTAMDTSGIQTTDIYQLAGMVQASSGSRVVESRMAAKEADDQNLPEYWIKRAKYYQGRREIDAVWATYDRALAMFPYKAGDSGSNDNRLAILREINSFGPYSKNEKAREIFRHEFAKAIDDNNYIFVMTRFLDDQFDDLIHKFFVNTSLLPRILSGRKNWRQDEVYVIAEVMGGDRWNQEKRQATWAQLAEMAKQNIRGRAFSLASEMIDQDVPEQAVPLLEACLKIAPVEYETGLNYRRRDVQEALFNAYLHSGNWRAAEQMYFNGYREHGDELGEIAAAAAEAGSYNDAVRIWRQNANRDRRNLKCLDKLSTGAAKPEIVKFYLTLKKNDPLSDIPDKALSILQ